MTLIIEMIIRIPCSNIYNTSDKSPKFMLNGRVAALKTYFLSGLIILEKRKHIV